MRRRDLGPGRHGFTLVEVIVALTVLAVGLLGFSATVGVVAARMSASLLETRVTTCAQAKLEELLAGGLGGSASEGCRQIGLELGWQVNGQDLKEIRVYVRGQLAGSEIADTLTTLARLP